MDKKEILDKKEIERFNKKMYMRDYRQKIKELKIKFEYETSSIHKHT
tara:strand:- start:90 stop:230 length:141 start_codon:yes stop_codon:yes gene_type:complete